MPSEWFSQQPARCKMDWGRQGASAAVGRGEILIIVDVLRFSSAVATAVHQGGFIYPCLEADDPAALAECAGAEIAGGPGAFSLSPLTYLGLEPGTRIVLPSPNGAACSRLGAQAPYLFAGALLNAEAVAQAVAHLLRATDLAVTVIACGERRRAPSEEDGPRFTIEDYLGAGAILSYLPWEKSAEARACEGAFRHARGDLAEILWDCGSGRELRDKGLGMDVQHAAQFNIYDAAPLLRGERFERL